MDEIWKYWKYYEKIYGKSIERIYIVENWNISEQRFEDENKNKKGKM